MSDRISRKWLRRGRLEAHLLARISRSPRGRRWILAADGLLAQLDKALFAVSQRVRVRRTLLLWAASPPAAREASLAEMEASIAQL